MSGQLHCTVENKNTTKCYTGLRSRTDCSERRRHVDSHMTLTLNLLTTTIVAPPSNACKWQMGFNSAFKGSIVW